MSDSFNHAQVQQLKLAVEQVIDAKLGENFMDRIENIEQNTAAVLKIAMDDRDELEITKAKVETIASHLHLSV